MKKMKRKLLTAALVLAIAGICAFAISEDSVLLQYFEAAEKLAFDEMNVTVNGEAEFSIDGRLFKRASVTAVMDGNNSLQKVQLFTPLYTEGAEGNHIEYRESGYTVTRNNREVFVTETLHPGSWRTGYSESRNSVVNVSSKLKALLGIAEAVIVQTEPLIKDRFTVNVNADGSESLTFVLPSGGAGALVDHAVTLLGQYVLERYFGADYNRQEFSDYAYADIYDYPTVTAGICYTMDSLSLTACSVNAVLNSDGSLMQVDGNCELTVILQCGEKYPASIRFSMSADQRGSSVVKPFEKPQPVTESEAGEGEYSREQAERKARLTEKAKRVLASTGYNADLSGIPVNVSAYADETGIRRYTCELLCGGEEEAFYVVFGREEQLIGLWPSRTGRESAHMEEYADSEPPAGLQDTVYEWFSGFEPLSEEEKEPLRVTLRYESRDGTWLQLESDDFMFIVRTEPEQVIEYCYRGKANG